MIVLFWSVYNIIVLLLAMAACVELPRYRGEERFATSERVRVTVGDDVFTAPIADFSVTGMCILAAAPVRPGDLVSVQLDEIGKIAGRVVRVSGAEFAVEFLDIDRSRDALIRKLYSGRYYGPPQELHGHRIVRAFVARALR